MVTSKSSIASSRLSTRHLQFICLLLPMMLVACGGGGGETATTSSPQGFTLSGTITAPTNAAVDWDVKDVNATARGVSNNALTATQPINSPVSLAGHLSLAEDTSDFFRVSLTADQNIGLYIADTDNADLDLYLYNSSGELQNSAMGPGASESLDISLGGDYIVEVRIVDLGSGASALDQASNYNMVIGKDLTTATSPKSMRLSDDFVPGDVLVRFTNNTFGSQNADPDQEIRTAQALGLAYEGGSPGRVMRMQFDSQSETATVLGALGMSKRALNQTATIADTERRAKQRTLEVIKAIRKRGDVLYAEPNYIRKAFATPNDTYFNLQWHYNQINLPPAWDQTTGSADVIVAVVDTGVLVNHPDLTGKLTGTGFDFVADPVSAGDGDGIDSNPDDPGDKANPGGSSSFHGTHVAGTIAAATGNSVGVSGGGWLTRVMAIRALGLGGAGTDFDIAQGILYAAGLANDSGTVPTIPADIINMSLGGDVDSQVVSDAVQAALGQGVIIVAAAGNESTSTPSFPAAYPGVVSVSAVDYATQLAYYSNFGDTIDVAAPGGDTSTDLNGDGFGDGVLSTLGFDGSGTIEMVYGFYQGTSMSAPHVAAVVALMKALRPALSPNDLNAFLASGVITTNIGSSSSFGNGLIDAQKAVLAAKTGEVPTLLSTNRSLLSFGIDLSGMIITAEKIGDTTGDLSIISATSDEAWLSVAPDTVDANGLGTYAITGDRSGLADGTYNGNITFVSSQNTVVVSVSMRVRRVASSADAGFHYVILADADTGETVYQSGARAQGGSYNFFLFNVAPGTYILRAGTDLDDDDTIGDPGEVIGVYLSLDQPQEITVNSHMSGLDFVSEFNIQITNAGTTARHQQQLLNERSDKHFDGR